MWTNPVEEKKNCKKIKVKKEKTSILAHLAFFWPFLSKFQENQTFLVYVTRKEMLAKVQKSL